MGKNIEHVRIKFITKEGTEFNKTMHTFNVPSIGDEIVLEHNYKSYNGTLVEKVTIVSDKEVRFDVIVRENKDGENNNIRTINTKGK